MSKFESFGGFGAKMFKVAGAFKSVERAALAEAGKKMVEHVQERIMWGQLEPDLADSTKYGRVRLKHAEEPPLFASGTFADSITYRVAGGEVGVGMKPGAHVDPARPGHAVDNDLLAMVHEFGSSRVPPRQPFGGMIDEYGDEITRQYVEDVLFRMEGML